MPWTVEDLNRHIENSSIISGYANLLLVNPNYTENMRLLADTILTLDAGNSIDEAAKILAQKDSYSHKLSAISLALRKRAISQNITDKVTNNDMVDYEDYYDYGKMPYVCDMYDTHVVYRQEGSLYQCEYSFGADNTVTLGDATEVQVSYVPTTANSPTTESVTIKGDLVPLCESKTTETGEVLVKVISPGWGSSGYYSENLLKEFGPKVFPVGTHMYLDHPTLQEDMDRPERTLKDLVGVTTSEVKWDDNGPTGKGLYANAKVFNNWREFVDEAAPYIGVSIRASGSVHDGVAEGRKGRIIDTFEQGFSVDYVTMAGRGGEVFSLAESARNKVNDSSPINVDTEALKEFKLDEKELLALKESNSKLLEALTNTQNELARLQERDILRDAREIVVARVNESSLPSITKARLIERFPGLISPPIDGKVLDRDKLIETIDAYILDEAKYLETVGSNVTSGRPVGVGAPMVVDVTESDAEKALNDSFANLGLSGKALEIAVKGH